MTFDTHPAVRLVREGRGVTMLVPEVDLVSVGSGALHVRDVDGRPVCHVRGTIVGRIEGVDPRADLIDRRSVCVTCRDVLGPVPPPAPVDEVEGGNALGITRTALDAERRRAVRAVRVAS